MTVTDPAQISQFWSRSEHGSRPVRIIQQGDHRWFEVGRPEGSQGCQVYDSARQMLMAFYGHDLKMTVERYFRFGKYQSGEEGGPVPFLFGQDAPGSKIAICGGIGDLEIVGDAALTVAELGVDLEGRYIEVRKLLMAGFGSKIRQAGLDPDDVLQEVYKGLLVRNDGRCPFDEDIASFGHYVHMVCRCILDNYLRRTGRWKYREVLGIRVLDDGGLKCVDVGEANLPSEAKPGGSEGVDFCVDRLQTWIRAEDPTERGRVAAEVVPLLYAGHTRKAMGVKLGMKPQAVTRIVSHVRGLARRWSA
jgi:hypothetical protein